MEHFNGMRRVKPLVIASCCAFAVAQATSGTAETQGTNIPIYNATISGTPLNTSVVTVPNIKNCNFTDDDLYCFPYSEAFVSMTGWTRFFYNPNYGLLRGAGLVDLTMYFAADDRPAATWTGIQNNGDIPINVNISWFTSTLSPQATHSVADPYYFYVRPNSAVYNAYPTGSSVGPTFYAVQTPGRLAAAGTTPTAQAGSTVTVGSSQTGTLGTQTIVVSSPLSTGAKVGISLAAIALFFALVILALLTVLYTRRKRLAQLAVLAHEPEKDFRRPIPGNLYTKEEWEVAGRGLGRGGGRPGGLGAVGVRDSMRYGSHLSDEPESEPSPSPLEDSSNEQSPIAEIFTHGRMSNVQPTPQLHPSPSGSIAQKRQFSNGASFDRPRIIQYQRP